MAHVDVIDDDDDEYEYIEDDEIYDRDGNVVWSRHYEGAFVNRVCQGCDSTFKGMPDHGFCNSCADIRERGGILPNDY
jgi:hypothetical protein